MVGHHHAVAQRPHHPLVQKRNDARNRKWSDDDAPVVPVTAVDEIDECAVDEDDDVRSVVLEAEQVYAVTDLFSHVLDLAFVSGDERSAELEEGRAREDDAPYAGELRSVSGLAQREHRSRDAILPRHPVLLEREQVA